MPGDSSCQLSDPPTRLAADLDFIQIIIPRRARGLRLGRDAVGLERHVCGLLLSVLFDGRDALKK
jgi:hypothetical protein